MWNEAIKKREKKCEGKLYSMYVLRSVEAKETTHLKEYLWFHSEHDIISSFFPVKVYNVSPKTEKKTLAVMLSKPTPSSEQAFHCFNCHSNVKRKTAIASSKATSIYVSLRGGPRMLASHAGWPRGGGENEVVLLYLPLSTVLHWASFHDLNSPSEAALGGGGARLTQGGRER